MDALTNLGIETWSLVLHLVNIFLLVVILTWILYKPIFAFLEKRQNVIKASIHEAETLKSEFEKKLQEMKKKQEQMRTDFEEQMDKGKKELESKRTELIEDMEEKRQSMLSDAKRDIDARKDGLVKEAEKEMILAMGKIIEAVIGDVADQKAVEKSIENEWNAFLTPHQS